MSSTDNNDINTPDNDDSNPDLDDSMEIDDDNDEGFIPDEELLKKEEKEKFEDLDRQYALSMQNEAELLKPPASPAPFVPPSPTPAALGTLPTETHDNNTTIAGNPFNLINNLANNITSSLAASVGTNDLHNSVEDVLGFGSGAAGENQLVSVLDRWRAKEDLTVRYESKYGASHPNFVTDSFRTALNTAKRNFKMLIIYLHCEAHENTDIFCFSLSSQGLVEYINENFVFWIGEITIPLEQVQRQLGTIGVTSIPFLGVVGEIDNSISIIDIIQDVLSEDDLIVRLIQLVDNFEPIANRMRAQFQEREALLEADRDIKKQQELAYQDSLVNDLQKAKEEEEEQIRQAEILSLLETKKQSKAAKKENLPTEPPKGTQGSTHLIIRLPSGDRLERRFNGSDTIQTVKDFIDSKVEETNFDSDEYTLASAYPRQTFADTSVSLQDAKLVPQALLHIVVQE